MEIYALEYILNPQRSLNRLGMKPRKGVLLRNEVGGFCDYFPWEEFGDLSIDSFLTGIKAGNIPSFVKNSLLLELDNLPEFKFLNHSLFEADSKCTCVKIKFFGDYQRLENEMKKTEGKIRLDFNQGLEKNDFFSWLNELDEALIKKIDFIEDPYLNHEEDFFRVPLAFDFNPAPSSKKISVKVFKPCREAFDTRFAERTIYTNNMGHELNQIITYAYLAKNEQAHDDHHGILMPKLYEGQNDLFLADGDRYSLDIHRAKLLIEGLKGKPWQRLI
mgnify:CR=1 FL=1